MESSFPSIEAEGNCRERERGVYVYGKIRFFMVDLFQPGDRRGSAVNGAIGWTKERRERVRGRRKQGSRGDRCTPRCFCFVGLTLRQKEGKEKKRKEEEGDGDKKGEALGLACPGSPATVVRSDDTYLSTSCACIHAHTSLPFRARTRMCVSRDYNERRPIYIHIHIYIKRIKKRGLVARYTLVRMRDVVSGCLQDT